MNIKEIFSEAWTLALRDYHKGGGWKKHIISLVASLVILLLVSYGLKQLAPDTGIGNSSLFFAAGILATMMGLTSLLGIFSLITDKKRFIRTLLIAPISRISILIGKIIYLFIASMKMWFVILLLIIFYFKIFQIDTLIFILLTSFAIIFLFSGLAMIIVSFVNKPTTGEKLTSGLTMFFYLLSGVIYPISSTPIYLKYIIYANPMTYCVDTMRYFILGTSEIPLWLNLLIVIPLAIILPIIGTYLFDKKLRQGIQY